MPRLLEAARRVSGSESINRMVDFGWWSNGCGGPPSRFAAPV